MNGLSKHFKDACQELSRGMNKGAYDKLKNAYPKFFKETNKGLDDDFSIKGIDKYKETMIKGFRKVEAWSD